MTFLLTRLNFNATITFLHVPAIWQSQPMTHHVKTLKILNRHGSSSSFFSDPMPLTLVRPTPNTIPLMKILKDISDMMTKPTIGDLRLLPFYKNDSQAKS